MILSRSRRTNQCTKWSEPWAPPVCTHNNPDCTENDIVDFCLCVAVFGAHGECVHLRVVEFCAGEYQAIAEGQVIIWTPIICLNVDECCFQKGWVVHSGALKQWGDRFWKCWKFIVRWTAMQNRRIIRIGSWRIDCQLARVPLAESVGPNWPYWSVINGRSQGGWWQPLLVGLRCREKLASTVGKTHLRETVDVRPYCKRVCTVMAGVYPSSFSDLAFQPGS